MKCHYTYDEKGKKHFIPMCYGNLHELKNENCNCPDPLTEHHFEKERFNLEIQKKNQTIEAMQSEINHLKKVIIKLNKYKL